MNILKYIKFPKKLNKKEIENFFHKKSKATFEERILTQITMIFNKFGSEGGVFILIGKKR